MLIALQFTKLLVHRVSIEFIQPFASETCSLHTKDFYRLNVFAQ